MFRTLKTAYIRQQEELEDLKEDCRLLRASNAQLVDKVNNLEVLSVIPVDTGRVEYTSPHSFYKSRVYKDLPLTDAIHLIMRHMGISLGYTEAVKAVKPVACIKSVEENP